MRTRNNPNAKKELKLYNNYIENKEELVRVINKNKKKKICLEIGMGKGTFITNKAYEDRENIYIGVELSETYKDLKRKKI